MATTEEATMAPEIRIRMAHAADAFELRRLAALDDARPLRGAVLLAEEHGEVRAALSLDDGRVVANPFARTSALVEMLRAGREAVAVKAA